MAPWTEEKKTKLRELITKGHTYSEVAFRFGDGTTRSAVAGQALRMGIKSANPWGSRPKVEKATPAKRPIVQRPSMPVVRAAAPVAAEPACSPVAPPIAVPPAPPKPRERVTFLEAGFGQCRWIMRMDPKRSGGALICGHPTLPGSSWCAEHRALCFTSAPKKTQAQMEADQKRSFAMLRKSGAARAFA